MKTTARIVADAMSVLPEIIMFWSEPLDKAKTSVTNILYRLFGEKTKQ